MPASRSSAIALSGFGPSLYGSAPVYQGLGSAVASVAGTAVPYQTRFTISLRSIAHATACRTRASSNGGFVQLNRIKSGLYGRLGETESSLDFDSSATRWGGTRWIQF